MKIKTSCKNVFSELGVSKIRVTGGEPTVRKDFFLKSLKFLKILNLELKKL